MKKYKSEMRMVMHQDAVLLREAGLISSERMRHFDETCLVPEASEPSCAKKPLTFRRRDRA